jgi:FkbM family methyltransferase
VNSRLKETVRGLLPRGIGRHRILAGPLKNAVLYTSWYDYPGALLGTTERPLLEWFEKNVAPGGVWLDVGAHFGYTAIALSRLVGEQGRVFAFEPVLQTAGCVSQAREANRLSNLEVVPFGLSDDSGLSAIRLHIHRGMADSGLKETSLCQTIFTMPLDLLWASIADNAAIAGVKIDVQGMEERVLSGMRRLLMRDRPKLVIEFHDGVSRDRICALLEACGYRMPGDAIEGPAAPPYEDNKSYAFFPAGGR